MNGSLMNGGLMNGGLMNGGLINGMDKCTVVHLSMPLQDSCGRGRATS